MPDFTTVSNELWIIILAFIFQVTNNLRFSEEGTQKRKDNYLRSRYIHFKKLYGKTIKDLTQNESLESIVYAVLIYEDFNRPKIARGIEELKFRITKRAHTLGVMQVQSDKFISDLESVKLGTKKIVNAYKAYLEKLQENDETYYPWEAKHSIISDYNGGTSYNGEVSDSSDIIKNDFYENMIDTLEPNDKNNPKVGGG